MAETPFTEKKEQLLYTKHRGGVGTWFRYNWTTVLVYLILAVLGVVNLYPFIWMLGTSLKAEAEASNNRLSPIPHMKFMLAEGFDANEVIPRYLGDPNVKMADFDDQLVPVRAKLEMLQEMQRRAQRTDILLTVSREWVDSHPFLTESKLVLDAQEEGIAELEDRLREIAPTAKQYKNIKQLRKTLKKRSDDLHKENRAEVREKIAEKVKTLSEKIARLETEGPVAKQQVTDLKKLIKSAKAFFKKVEQSRDRLKNAVATMADAESFSEKVYDLPSLGGPAAKAVTTQAAGDEIAGREAVFTKLPPETTVEELTALGFFRKLVKTGVLVEDKAHGGFWLSEAARAGNLSADKLNDRERKVAQKIRDHYLITTEVYIKVTRVPMVDTKKQLPSMARGPKAPLTRIREFQPGDANTPDVLAAYVVKDWARGAVHKKMRPRQILTIMQIWKENQRRRESRATFAAYRWTIDAYEENYGMESFSAASEELYQLADKKYLSPAPVQWMNYWVVLKGENLVLNFATSLLITVSVVFLTVMISSMLGYALARIRFPGKFLVLGVMIAASILPGEARIIPIFKMLMTVGLMKNLYGVVLWLTSFGVGNALLMAAFFYTLPREVDEAAEVDGAGVFRKFFDIALPMARPIVMTVGLFAFLMAWNNFLIPLLCTISRPSMQPLAVAVYDFQQGHPGKWHQINAAASVMIVPVILMFLLVQKHVIKSIAIGAVKG